MGSRENSFTCQRCGACCRVPGYVRLTEADVLAIARHLGLTPEAFVETFAELTPSRTGLRIKGSPEEPCAFLTQESLCRIHAVRPQQCRDYPARWQSRDIERVCQAQRNLSCTSF